MLNRHEGRDLLPQSNGEAACKETPGSIGRTEAGLMLMAAGGFPMYPHCLCLHADEFQESCQDL